MTAEELNKAYPVGTLMRYPHYRGDRGAAEIVEPWETDRDGVVRCRVWGNDTRFVAKDLTPVKCTYFASLGGTVGANNNFDNAPARALKGYENPDWVKTSKCHDWKNHVPDTVQTMWHTFTSTQQELLFKWAEGLADAEEWE